MPRTAEPIGSANADAANVSFCGKTILPTSTAR